MSRFIPIITENAETLAEAAADWLLDQVKAYRRPFSISLSGGSTPQRLYQLLAAPKLRDAFPWNQAHWFWGDERFVPHDHPDSNYRMVCEALLNHVPAPAANIHPISGSGTPEAAAAAYERTLKIYYGADRLDPARPLFDVTLMGLGTDGHTASLFPGTAALHETARWAMAVIGAKPEARITLTYPILNSSRAIAFLTAGSDKRPQLSTLLAGTSTAPAAGIHPIAGGTLHFFMDRAAAPVLEAAPAPEAVSS